MDNYDLEDMCIEAFVQEPVYKNTEYTNETKRNINENEDPMYAMVTEAFGDDNSDKKDDEKDDEDKSTDTSIFGANNDNGDSNDSEETDDESDDDSSEDNGGDNDDDSSSSDTTTTSDDNEESSGMTDLFGGTSNSDMDAGGLTKISDFGVKALLFSTLVHFWHLNCERNGQHTALADLYDSLEDNGDKILEAVIGQTKNPVSPSELEFEYGDLSFGDEAINKIKEFRDEACDLEGTLDKNAGLANILADIVEDCDSAIYKLTRLD